MEAKKLKGIFKEGDIVQFLCKDSLGHPYSQVGHFVCFYEGTHLPQVEPTDKTIGIHLTLKLWEETKNFGTLEYVICKEIDIYKIIEPVKNK